MPQIRPLSRLQTLIARNMHRALQETAHATLHTECDVTALVEALGAEGGAAVSLGTHVLYALTQALREHPELNAHLTTDELCVYETIKFGMMVDGGPGVKVACIPDAGAKTPAQLEEAAQDLRRRALRNQLQVAETRGSTFMVVDLSAFPVDAFTPILLPSAIAILGIGRVRAVCRPTASGCRPVQLLSLSLTFDHRGTDGLAAGRFLATVVRRLEQP